MFKAIKRAWRSYRESLALIRERRSAGLCLMCGEPSGWGDFCDRHDVEEMAAP